MANPQHEPAATLDMMEQINFTLQDIRRETTAVERALAFLCYVMIWNKCARDQVISRVDEEDAIKNTEIMFHKLCQDFTRTRMEDHERAEG